MTRSRFTNWYMSTFPKLAIWQAHRMCNAKMDHDIFGVRPKHAINQQHPSLSDELHGKELSTYKMIYVILGKITSGTVVVKGNIKQFTETSVIFEDGFELKDVDDVIMATGYWFDFPYLDSGKLIPVKENRCKLYKRMFPLTSADKNTIAVIGLLQVGN